MIEPAGTPGPEPEPDAAPGPGAGAPPEPARTASARLAARLAEAPTLPRKALHFARSVVGHFFGTHHGLVLSGAVAYNTLLSLIPAALVVLVILSHVVDEGELLRSVGAELRLVAPGQAEVLVDAMRSFLANRALVGVLGALVLLFLSSIAFRILEDSFDIVFHRPVLSPLRRSYWVSVLIPFAFMAVFGLFLLVVTVLTSLLEQAGAEVPARGTMLLSGFLSEVALFTALYKVLPRHRISWRRALAGGVVAAVLWELVRALVTYYFTHISLVGVVYGSLATVIVVLVTLEVGSVIVLLGAEVIAELEHNDAAGLPWHGLREGEGGSSARRAAGEAPGAGPPASAAPATPSFGASRRGPG